MSGDDRPRATPPRRDPSEDTTLTDIWARAASGPPPAADPAGPPPPVDPAARAPTTTPPPPTEAWQRPNWATDPNGPPRLTPEKFLGRVVAIVLGDPSMGSAWRDIWSRPRLPTDAWLVPLRPADAHDLPPLTPGKSLAMVAAMVVGFLIVVLGLLLIVLVAAAKIFGGGWEVGPL